MFRGVGRGYVAVAGILKSGVVFGRGVGGLGFRWGSLGVLCLGGVDSSGEDIGVGVPVGCCVSLPCGMDGFSVGWGRFWIVEVLGHGRQVPSAGNCTKEP
jgi:hypothetical protein